MKRSTLIMKRVVMTSMTLAICGGFTAVMAQQAGIRYGEQHGAHSDRARVTRVEQIDYRRNSYRRQECWNDSRNRNEGGYYRDDDGRLYRDGDGRKSGGNGGAIIGALVGGALGNQVGKGDGRTAATIAGLVIGATIGKHSGNDYDRFRDDSGSEYRCRTVADDDYRNRYGDYRYPDDTRYRVTYAYAGRNYQSYTSNRPGRYVRVLVDVQLQD